MYSSSKIKIFKKDFKGGYIKTYSMYSTNVERTNWTELEKSVFFLGDKKLERGTFGTLHEYLNLGDTDTYSELIVKRTPSRA